MARPVLLPCLLLLSTQAVACDPKPFDPVDHGRDATLAVVGYVVGERYPDFESSVADGERPPRQRGRGERLVRVAVADVLKGSPDRVIEAPVACAAPFPVLFERVVVVQGLDEYLRVFSASETESELRASIPGAR